MSDASTARFLQGRFPFTGAGFETLSPIDDTMRITVPAGKTLQAVYFRGGNSSDELATVALVHNGSPVRYFSVGARDGIHIPLRLVEDFESGDVLELQVTAPDGAGGSLVIDLGLVEF